ncbi:hypothetical protein KHQ82_01260 [Mycoplasmatota bacterium]|nr:hypothetical protein KHQ82_01260 [Mycoplasmatota bacterium]
MITDTNISNKLSNAENKIIDELEEKIERELCEGIYEVFHLGYGTN